MAISIGSNDYNLNDSNCTHFVIGACDAGGINVPQTIGRWPGGQVLNSGDLGNDIRNITLLPNYVSRGNGGGMAVSDRGTCN